MTLRAGMQQEEPQDVLDILALVSCWTSSSGLRVELTRGSSFFPIFIYVFHEAGRARVFLLLHDKDCNPLARDGQDRFSITFETCGGMLWC